MLYNTIDKEACVLHKMYRMKRVNCHETKNDKGLY